MQTGGKFMNLLKKKSNNSLQLTFTVNTNLIQLDYPIAVNGWRVGERTEEMLISGANEKQLQLDAIFLNTNLQKYLIEAEATKNLRSRFQTSKTK